MMLPKKIKNGIDDFLRFLRRRRTNSVRPPTYTKQNYTPFHAKSSSKSSRFKSGVKRLLGVFTGDGRQGGSKGFHRKNDRRQLAAFLCLGAIVLAFTAYLGRGWLNGMVSKIEYFEVQDNVEIDGCRMTTPAEIREFGEIRYHTNLFSINPAKLEAILARLPWVAGVSVHRSWPNRLLIRIVEHAPEALVTQGEPGKDQLYYVDGKGMPFTQVKPGQDLDYPVLTGLQNIREADKRKAELSDALHFLRLVKANNPNLPAQSISEIHFDKAEGLVVYLVDYPFPIYFGTGNVGKKYKQLQEVLGVLYKQRKEGMIISQVEYIRMDYLTDKVLVAQSGSG